LSQEHVADIVETLNEQAKTAPDIVAQLPLDRAIEVLDQPGLDAPADLVQALPRDRTVAARHRIAVGRDR
jgi:magnesium transporter